jgi:HEAT repeat protein
MSRFIITEDAVASETHTDRSIDEDIKIRASAIIAMGKAGDRDAVTYLVQTLENTSEVDWLRACAAIALGRLSGEEVVQPLIDALRDDNNTVLRAVISALGDARCRQAVPYLKETLKDSTKQELHALTVTVLGLIGGDDITPTLLEALKSANNQVRVRAAAALRDLRTEKAVIPFISLLNDNDECLRAIAASSLGLIGDKRAADTLMEALNDNAETVRAIAASSLGCLGDTRAVPRLKKALNDRGRTVRRQAAAALAKLGRKKTRHK